MELVPVEVFTTITKEVVTITKAADMEVDMVADMVLVDNKVSSTGR